MKPRCDPGAPQAIPWRVRHVCGHWSDRSSSSYEPPPLALVLELRARPCPECSSEATRIERELDRISAAHSHQLAIGFTPFL
jgi:hypothetical protein